MTRIDKSDPQTVSWAPVRRNKSFGPVYRTDREFKNKTPGRPLTNKQLPTSNKGYLAGKFGGNDWSGTLGEGESCRFKPE